MAHNLSDALITAPRTTVAEAAVGGRVEWAYEEAKLRIAIERTEDKTWAKRIREWCDDELCALIGAAMAAQGRGEDPRPKLEAAMQRIEDAEIEQEYEQLLEDSR